MRAGVVYTIIIIGFVALFLISNQPHRQKLKSSRRVGPGRRLTVRRGPAHLHSKHAPVAFDPIVADFEQRNEDLAWEQERIQQHQQKYRQRGQEQQAAYQYSTSDHSQAHHVEEQHPDSWASEDDDNVDAEDYLNDESHFNISHRLTILFPLVDANPRDGYITLPELMDWHLQQGLKRMLHRTDLEMEIHDKNNDGLVTFREYLPHFSDLDIVNNSMEQGGAGWWKEQFELADEDGDGALNQTEYNNFLHPEDSNNEKLLQWLRKEEIRERDKDKDGKLNFVEFHQNVFDIIKFYYHEVEYSQLQHGPEYEAKRDTLSKQKFSELDRNKDGFLSEDELQPIIEMVHPGETAYARQQADYLMQQADMDKDGRLTLEEMLANPYSFYSTAYGPNDDDYFHDEF